MHAEMKKNETVHAYMYRLEDLAQAAFPKIDEQEGELTKKLMRSAPSDFISKVKEQSWLQAQTGAGYMSWEQVKVLASFREENREKRRQRDRDSSGSEREEEREIANVIVKEGQRKPKEENKQAQKEKEGQRSSPT